MYVKLLQLIAAEQARRRCFSPTAHNRLSCDNFPIVDETILENEIVFLMLEKAVA
jgi:hypothetical protein